MSEAPPPPGAPAGGEYKQESYIGIITLIIFVILLFVFWPAAFGAFCCPCDTRKVYIVNGTKYVPSGLLVPPNECCGFPCLGPSA